MEGGGVTRGDTTNSQGGQKASTPAKKRDTTRGSNTKRGGQVEATLDWRWWQDKKLEIREQEAT